MDLMSELDDEPVLTTSKHSLVEVSRAAALSRPGAATQRECERLLSSCALVDVSESVLKSAAGLTSHSIRSLDAIHLASALLSKPDALLAYDRRLIEAARAKGLKVLHPGML